MTVTYTFDGTSNGYNLSGTDLDDDSQVLLYDGGNVVMTSDGWSRTQDGIALAGNLVALPLWKVSLSGSIAAMGASNTALSMTASAKSTVSVAQGATVIGTYAGFASTGGTALTNAGQIQGKHFGLLYGDTADAVTITNAATGTIDTTYDPAGYGIAISITGSGKHTITNSGTITGQQNSILIAAASLSADTVTNNAGGRLDGDVDLGHGNDTIINKGFINGNALIGDGDNSLTNSGNMGAVTTLGGDDKITNTGTLGAVSLGGGNDTLITSRYIGGTVDLGEGLNHFTNTGSVIGNIIAGTGNDVFSNSNVIVGDLDAGNGINSFTNKGTITGHVTFGGGSDVITNSGTITGGLDTGEGQNHLTNSGTIAGLVKMGGSGDTVSNSGAISSFIDGDGADHFTNSGYLSGVSMGGGDDYFTNSGKGNVNAIVDMGKGNDVFTGGSGFDMVVDGQGQDTYNLGDGYDTFYAIGWGSGSTITSVDTNVDTIDGGAGALDFYSAQSAPHEITINIDKVAHSGLADDSGVSEAANQAEGKDVYIDKIKNFECAQGGDGDDHIFGTAGANQLYGGYGADHLYGYDGNDKIDGQQGSDVIWGGLGADALFGGTYDDGVDTFLYTSTTESTVALSGRDTINDFSETSFGAGKDVIEFYKMGLHLIDHDNFVDVKFTGAGNEVRVLETGAGWTVQADTDGNGISDMAIDVADAGHMIHWTADNFAFVSV